jgi:3-hydroxy-D-aspartate aldolase
LARHGIACPTIAGAGTGSFEFEQASGVYTELQCGSYIFLDADYGRDLDRDAIRAEPLGVGDGDEPPHRRPRDRRRRLASR